MVGAIGEKPLLVKVILLVIGSSNRNMRRLAFAVKETLLAFDTVD